MSCRALMYLFSQTNWAKDIDNFGYILKTLRDIILLPYRAKPSFTSTVFSFICFFNQRQEDGYHANPIQQLNIS